MAAVNLYPVRARNDCDGHQLVNLNRVFRQFLPTSHALQLAASVNRVVRFFSSWLFWQVGLQVANLLRD